MDERLHNRFIVVSYLFYIAIFGVGVSLYLWLRDLRIYARTALQGYRNAAYKGILHTTIATLGAAVVYYFPDIDILGLGILMLGLYLQGQVKKEKIWTDETIIVRALGKARIKKSGK